MTTTNAVDHGITIEAQPWHEGGPLFVAMCLCGWWTPPFMRRDLADASVARHIADPNPAPLAPVQCAPWCEYGDCHTDAMFIVDQRCYSPDLRIDLMLHEPVAESFHVEGYGYVPGPGSPRGQRNPGRRRTAAPYRDPQGV